MRQPHGAEEADHQTITTTAKELAIYSKRSLKNTAKELGGLQHMVTQNYSIWASKIQH